MKRMNNVSKGERREALSRRQTRKQTALSAPGAPGPPGQQRSTAGNKKKKKKSLTLCPGASASGHTVRRRKEQITHVTQHWATLECVLSFNNLTHEDIIP